MSISYLLSLAIAAVAISCLIRAGRLKLIGNRVPDPMQPVFVVGGVAGLVIAALLFYVSTLPTA